MFIGLVLFCEIWIYDFMIYKCILIVIKMFKKNIFYNIVDFDGN